MPAQQSFQNHTRFDPPFHFFVMPGLLINLILAVVYTTRHWYDHAHLGLWWIFLGIVLLVLGFTSRASALRAQDRTIRLEEHLRMAALGVPAATAHACTAQQLIALRFASDAELPALAQRALAENLTPKQIKQSITTWRPDTLRV